MDKKDVRIKVLFQLYAEALGFPGKRNPTFTAKMHVARICMKIPKISAVVRPLGGKVTKDQVLKLRDYIVANPLALCSAETIDQILTASQPSNRCLQKKHFPSNPKIARRIKGKAVAATMQQRDDFYRSWEWKRVRMDALLKYGPVCMCCGARRGDKTPQGDDVRIVVDHVRPIAKYWERRLDPTNLQILCDECNMGKGSRLETDFRPVTTEEIEPISDEISEEVRQQLTYYV